MPTQIKGKPIGTKDKKRGQKKGLKPKQRKLATTVRTQAKKGKLTANQWQNTPQQNLFMELWMNPDHKDTFGKAIQAAQKAGYSTSYSLRITAPSNLTKWISEYRKGLELTPKHIENKLQQIVLNENNNSRSPADTQLKGLELLMKLHNIGEKTSNLTVNVVQPILASQSVRKQVDNQDVAQ